MHLQTDCTEQKHPTKMALITLLWIRIRLKRKLYVDKNLLMLTYPLFPFTTMHDPRYFKGSV
ncbi:MAG: hypothetical protein OXC03_03600, partial [Flavobacteriaceae bacterium]|nr:hypothetical protein [Flavobacteriaceae bacterium]